MSKVEELNLSTETKEALLCWKSTWITFPRRLHNFNKTNEGFRDKMRHINFLRFLFYTLKHYILIIPTTDNFCFDAHVKNVDTRGNQRLQNFVAKEEKISSFCPLSELFKNGVYRVLS